MTFKSRTQKYIQLLDLDFMLASVKYTQKKGHTKTTFWKEKNLRLLTHHVFAETCYNNGILFNRF